MTARVWEFLLLSLIVEERGQLGAAGVACDSTGVSVCAPAVACSPPPSFACYAVVQAAGGMSHDGDGSVLDQVIHSTTTRSLISVGSRELVEESIPALQACRGGPA